MVIVHDAGYDINNTYSDLLYGNIKNIHTILVPTVPIIDNIMGTAEYPIPRNAPGNKSIIPHKKYGTVVIERIYIPHFITSGSFVYIPNI